MSLQKILSSVQVIGEAIASVVNIDVTIVDDKRVRLAGTGRYKDSIGETVSSNSAFSYALDEGVGFIIDNPGSHQACLNCDCKEKCSEHAEVCCPILLDGKAIGVIGLIAFEEAQRLALIGNQQNLMSFLDRMADLIATKLKEFESHEAMELMAKELEVVVDNLDTSLVATDKFGKIVRVNRKFRKTFHIAPHGNVEGILIQSIIGDAEWHRIMTLKDNSKNRYHTFTNGLQGMYDVALVKVHQTIKGFIVTIKTMEEVINTVSDMMMEPVLTQFDDIIGESERMKEAKALALKVASSGSTVLILGESGTGKELFARAIHQASPRNRNPFVAVNCAAIPDHLLESELFGYEEGAFTGAKRGGKPGKFQLANNGTLFLDEIGDMPLHLQGKLLRALQEKRIDRLGSDKPIEIDVRVIAATHRDLEERVIEGSFRQDLFYRLNVIPIMVPSLRQRRADIELTTNYMIDKWCTKLGKLKPKVSVDFMNMLMAHHWPGNVRELENAIEYAVNVCDEETLSTHHLPKRIWQAQALAEPEVTQTYMDIKTIETLEKEAIINAIQIYSSRSDTMGKVAEVLGLSRATLYRKIKQYDLKHL